MWCVMGIYGVEYGVVCRMSERVWSHRDDDARRRRRRETTTTRDDDACDDDDDDAF